MSVDKRLDRLEQLHLPPSKIIVVGCREYDWTPAQLAEAVAAAQETAGENDIIISVAYGAWPPGGSDG